MSSILIWKALLPSAREQKCDFDCLRHIVHPTVWSCLHISICSNISNRSDSQQASFSLSLSLHKLYVTPYIDNHHRFNAFIPLALPSVWCSRNLWWFSQLWDGWWFNVTCCMLWWNCSIWMCHAFMLNSSASLLLRGLERKSVVAVTQSVCLIISASGLN